MKRIYPLVLPLTPLAVVLGLLLLPSRDERSEQLLHDGRFEAAEPLLANRFESGDRSTRVVQGIARARISQGDIKGAINFLENAELHGKTSSDLVQDYETGLLTSFSFEAYRLLKSNDSSADSLRQVSLLAGLSGDLAGERDALEKLSGSDRATPGEIMRLALIEGRLGNSKASLDKLDHLIELYPGFVTVGIIELLAKMAQAAGPEGEANVEKRVIEFIDRHPKSNAAWQLGWSLIEVGYPGIATNILLSRGDAIFRDPKLLEVVSAALAKSSRQRELLPAVERNLMNGTVNESTIRTLVAAKIFDRNFLAGISGAFAHDRIALQDETAMQLAALASEKFSDRSIAIQFLLKVASRNQPNHQAMRGLIFLWGPVADKDAIAWLDERTRNSHGSERLAWIEHIVNLGDEQRAVSLLEGSTTNDLRSIGAFARRVIPTGLRASSIAALFELSARHEQSPDQLLVLAGMAKDLGQFDAAEKLARTILSKNADSVAGSAFLAMLFSERNREREAAPFLHLAILRDPSLATLSRESRARMFLLYGLNLEEAREKAKAMEAFQKGFQVLKSLPKVDYSRELFARLMAKAEGTRPAINWLKESSRIKPLNDGERLFLGNLLAEVKEFSEAKSVLFGGREGEFK